MDRRRQLELWSDQELGDYIRSQARRHFARLEDQEDACAEAWERICKLPSRSTRRQIRAAAYNAINALYKRLARRRQRECPHNSLAT